MGGGYQCRNCDKLYHTSESYRRHVCKPIPGTQCNICGKMYSSKQNCDKHKARIHKFVHDRKIRCRLCSITTSSLPGFKTHFTLKHLKEYYTCESDSGSDSAKSCNSDKDDGESSDEKHLRKELHAFLRKRKKEKKKKKNKKKKKFKDENKKKKKLKKAKKAKKAKKIHQSKKSAGESDMSSSSSSSDSASSSTFYSSDSEPTSSRARTQTPAPIQPTTNESYAQTDSEIMVKPATKPRNFISKGQAAGSLLIPMANNIGSNVIHTPLATSTPFVTRTYAVASTSRTMHPLLTLNHHRDIKQETVKDNIIHIISDDDEAVNDDELVNDGRATNEEQVNHANHADTMQNSFICLICSDVRYSDFDLKQHEKFAHGNQPHSTSLMCYFCNHFFESGKLLAWHLKACSRQSQ